jgi:L-fuculose-phosphate aldolase
LPEVEVFLGVVPRAAYETPGGKSFAETVRPFIGKANTVVLSNHGTVSWGPTVEKAYWHTEILDAYCRILLLSQQIGHVERLSDTKMNELLDLKERFGAGVDPRRSGGALCVNTEFAGNGESGGAAVDPGAGRPNEHDRLVQRITALVVEALQRR